MELSEDGGILTGSFQFRCWKSEIYLVLSPNGFSYDLRVYDSGRSNAIDANATKNLKKKIKVSSEFITVID